MTNPIFIVGASRSGTTMLATMLGRHSMLQDIGETHYFGDLCSPDELSRLVSSNEAIKIAAAIYARSRKTIWSPQPDPEDLNRAQALLEPIKTISLYALFSAVADDLARHMRKVRAVEQTPRNIYYVTQILNQDDGARFIEIVRDPRAVLHSQRQRWRMRFLGAPNVPYSESIRTFMNYHAITMSLLWRGAARAGMAHARSPRYLRIRYEDLVSNPEQTLAQICAFVGVQYEHDMLAIPRLSSSTAMNQNTKPGVSKDSLDQWKTQLPKGDRALCAKMAGREARLLNYDVAEESLLSPSVVWHLLRYPFHLAGSVAFNPGRVLTQLNGLRKTIGLR